MSFFYSFQFLGLFFLPTCACVDYWADMLPIFLTDMKIFAIHGKMKLKRGKILDKFRQADKTILLCTDLLARSVRITNLSSILDLKQCWASVKCSQSFWYSFRFNIN